MNDFLNSLNNSIYDSLCHFDLQVHNKIKDTSVDNFIHELKDYLIKSDVTYRLSKLPKDTFLDINEIEKEYIQCYLDSIEYPVPKEMVYSEDLIGLENDGHIKLQLQDDNLYHVIRFENGKPVT